MDERRRSPVNGSILPEGRPFEAGEEARESGRKGGKASGRVRRAKKTLREELEYLLVQPVTDKKTGKRIMAKEALSAALINAGLHGNVKAYEVIRDTIGEKPAENVTVSAPDTSALDAAFALLKDGAWVGGDGNESPGTGAAADC